MRKPLSTAALCALLACCAGAQTAADAVRLAYLNPGGTGRFMGVGGAFGALGAEFSSTGLNPAGLAMYRTGELVFSPALRFARTEATLPGAGLPYPEGNSAFRLDNVGIVFHSAPRRSRWKTFNVGIGLNQMANFTRSVYYTGFARGTILTTWFNEAQPLFQSDPSGRSLDPFTGGLAFEANAFYPQNNRLSYDFEGNESADLLRTHTIAQSGQVNEVVLSLAGNYDERLFVGATLGIPLARYRFEGDYLERDADDNVVYFDDLTFAEYLETSGVGLNGKFGIIYRASQQFRIGTYFHTPTQWRLTDNFANAFSYQYTDGSGTNRLSANSPDGIFDYRLSSPWRAGIGLAFLRDKKGFLSADLEWIDYSSARYNFTPRSANTAIKEQERRVNAQILRQYKGTANLRLGGELAFSVFRLRAGISLLGKPEADKSGFTAGYSAGIGVKAQGFFLDLGARTSAGAGTIVPYADGPVVNTRNRVSDILLSIGFKF